MACREPSAPELAERRSVENVGARTPSDIVDQVAAPTPAQNLAPTVAITLPADGADFFQGWGATFSGSATDPEDGPLSGPSLVWTSSLDGQLRTGDSFSTGSLSLGTHLITLTATDSQGATSSASLHVTILPAPSPPANAPPLAFLGPTSCTGQQYAHQCSFDATPSTDDVGIVLYTWTWGNGRHESHRRPTVRNTWARAGTYLVTLVVADSGGLTSSTQVSVDVP